MFTPSTWFLLSKNLADLWYSLEQQTNEIQTSWLTKYSNNPSQWYQNQLKAIPNFAKTINKIANKQFAKINSESAEAIKRAINLVDNEILKSIKKANNLTGDIKTSKDGLLQARLRE